MFGRSSCHLYGHTFKNFSKEPLLRVLLDFLEIRGFKMLQMRSDGFLPVIDINITNQAVKGTSKPCLKEVEGVVYINCAHKSGGHCASEKTPCPNDVTQVTCFGDS